MPYPNEHAARLRDPGNYVRFRRENDKFGVGVHAVWGIKASGTVELQAIRFDAKKFTVAEAKTWLKDHKYTPILFEPASGKKSDEEEGMESRIVKILPLSVRADLGPRSIDEDARTVELIITTATGIRRRDWMTGKEYVEVLSMDPAHVRLERINNGAPLLDSHNSFSVADQLGVVVPKSVELMKKAMVGKVRFSKREAVEPVWADVKDGVITNVSVGYRVYAYEETPPKNESAIPIRTAVSWEPFEVSMVPIPADAGAKVRAEESSDGNECEIVMRAAEQPAVAVTTTTVTQVTTMKEKTMPEEKRSDAPESFHADLSLTPPPKAAPPAEPTERDQGAVAERERVAKIRAACINGKVSRALETELIEKGVPLTDAQARILEEVGKRDVSGTPSRAPAGAGDPDPDIRVGDDPFIHVRAGIEEALLYKAHPYRPAVGRDPERGFKVTDRAREYMGLSLIRTAERYLVMRGVRTQRMSEMEIAGLAMGLSERGGMHSTSDFANLLADVAGKTLRQAYQEAPQTFGPITRSTTAADFKDIKRLQLGEAPALEEVGEHGEIKSGSVGEGKETYHLATYAKRFAITRKALINDDLDAFSRLPVMFGRQARNKESDLLWACITDNPAMGDGHDLFDATYHHNLDAVGSVISVEAISAGRAAMRTQTGVDGETLLNISPRYLIVPAALETDAQRFVAPIVAAEAGNVNPFAGLLTVIAEPRLDACSEIAWYLAASVADGQDVLELAMLEGQDGPLVEQELGFNVDGIQMRVRHDIGAKAIDWRGLYENAGAS